MSGGFDLDLGDPERNGVYAIDDADLDSLAALARAAGCRVLRVDLRGCADKRTLLARLAVQLDFPAAFSRNWDALNDALGDLEWLPASGYALLLESSQALQRGAGADFAILLDILDDVAARWSQHGVAFTAFVGHQQAP